MVGMMDLKKDVIFSLILLTSKLTSVPEIEWWMPFIPIVVGFSVNFIRGFVKGQKDAYEHRNK